MSHLLLSFLLPIAASHASTPSLEHQPQQRQDLVQYRTDLEWLDFYADFGNGQKLAQRLDQLPSSAWSSNTIRSLILTSYADIIADTVGVDKAVSYIDKVAGNVPVVDHKTFAKQSYQRTKALQEKLNSKPSELSEAEALAHLEKASVDRGLDNAFRVVQKKSDLLAFYGQPASALDVVNQFAKSVPADSRLAKRIDSYVKQLGMIGKPFPTLAYKSIQGSFSGLGSLKGKVVILQLDRDAGHNPWRELNSRVSDLYESLKGQGLEMVTIVDAQPYESEESVVESISRDIRDHKIKWPVIKGEEASEKQYKFSPNAHAIVLDRTGTVRFIQSEPPPRTEALKLLRARVEKLLAEK